METREEPLPPPAKPLVKQRKGSQLMSPTSPLGGGGGQGQGWLREVEPMPMQETGEEMGKKPALPVRKATGGAGEAGGGAGAQQRDLMDMDIDGDMEGGWEVLKPR